ncbi:SusC/RagA family TonB-linked outer membrane protein [Mucilaginibacter calamicampi]|uniref:SusC/RagA family TonB-linked outer membrane protein n=1 Tax=Mucilaginibacter calamicampi TaxID=1302352 RepID=A0ABW2Z3L1_9SPHI
MKKRRGTPSYNRIVTSVFALLLCASAAQADSPKTNKNSGASANVLGNVLQAKTVTGKVVDDKGEILVGVTVTEQGTQKATTTDANGNYTLSVTSDNSILAFSYIGFETQTQTVGARTAINVTLAPTNGALQEVVVTALGIKREAKKLGYAATTVKVDEITQNRTTNVMSSLEGKVAGLNISPPAAGPGSSTRIRLRGQAAFGGNNVNTSNSPLIVVNGLPMDQGEQAVGPNNTTDRGDALQQINQDDIESFNVLKGSTAAALYGSRAANGAIIITTKSGSKNSKFGVEFNSNFASDQVLDYNRYQTQYGMGLWDTGLGGGKMPTTVAEAIAGGGQTWGAKHDPSKNAMYFDGVLRPYVAHPNRITEYYRTGTSFNNTIALSGGNSTTSYRMSYSNQDAKGISPVNDYHKKIVNLGLNSKVGEKLTLTFNLNYANEINNNPPQVGFQGAGAPNFFYRMSPSIPIDALRDSAVDPATGAERVTSAFQTTLLNPYFSNPRQFNKRNGDRYLATTTARYDFNKYLYLQGRVAMDHQTLLTEGNTPHGVGSANLLQNGNGPAYNGNYNVNMSRQRNMNYDFLMGTNNHKFGDFSAELTVGGNIRDDRGSGIRSQTANGLVIRDVYTIENGVQKNVNYDYNNLGVNSLYGIADFGYKNFLYLTVTDRVDWFSVLTFPSTLVQTKNNAYNYPSVSGSFVWSELLPNVSWLNYGKLRASYAATGSASGINNFSGVLNYNLAANQFVANGISYNTASYGAQNPNPLVEPFGVTEKEVGLEIKTLGNRLNFDIAAYDKTTNKQILIAPLSAASGVTSTPVNLGKLQNKGLEFLVEGTPIRTQNFTWVSSMNASYNESRVLQLAAGATDQLVNEFNANGNEFLGKLMYKTGMAMNQLQSFTYLRNAAGQIVVGADGRLLRSASEVTFGQADPKWIGGWQNTFRYKRLSLLVHVDYKFGGKTFSSTALNGLRQGLTQASLVGREGGVKFPAVIQGTGANNADRAVGVIPQTFYTDYRNLQIADPFVFNSDFIKLRNITLTYDFSDMIKNVKGIKGLTLSASCRNVAILHKAIPDVDPESMASTGDTRLGYEQSALPTTRTFGLNLNVKF